MHNRPPSLTFTSRLFVRLIDATVNWSRRRAWLSSFAVLAASLGIEALLPVAMSAALLYMLATTFAVWCIGRNGGLLLGFVAVVASGIVKHYGIQQLNLPGVSLVTEVWNTIARFGSVAVLAIVVSGLRSALALERWRACTDGLTGALNKLAFEEQLEIRLADARARGGALVLAYMDLDGFKGVNDAFGHSAGDGVLRVFASGAADAIRATDLFARIGGDEFAALLSVRSCEEGWRVAGMLHDRLSGVLARTGYAVTCSMGALVADASAMSEKGGTLALADALMYDVKRAGKNALRIAYYDPVGVALHAAYPPVAEESLTALLARIDAADAALRMRGSERRAA